MEIQELDRGSGGCLAAFILGVAQESGVHLTTFKLHGLVYLVYGLGLEAHHVSLVGGEKLRCYPFGPCFESLLSSSASFGAGAISMDRLLKVKGFDVERLGEIPWLSSLVREVLELQLSGNQLCNITNANPDDPWAVVLRATGANGFFAPEIEHELIRLQIRKLIQTNVERLSHESISSH